MYSNRLFALIASLCSVGAAACGSSSDEGGEVFQGGSCFEGEMFTCACTNGTSGTQTCLAGGQSLSACSCGSGSVPVGGGMTGGPGTGGPGTGGPGTVDPGTVDPGTVGPGTGDPGTVDPGTGDPGTVDPGIDPGIDTPDGRAYSDRYACNLNTGWLSDGACILPPDPADGFQLHYGPTDYDNPTEVNQYVVQPGGELVHGANLVTPNDTEILYQEYHLRLRSGTHHMILWGNESSGGLALPRFILGGQGALGDDGGGRDVPNDNVAPENHGMGWRMAPRQPVEFEMHYVNTRDEPLLREGWLNVHYADPANVTQVADPISFFGALNLSVPPQTVDLEGATCQAPATEVRILSLSGHFHAAGTRFSAWLVSGGQRQLVYETYDWSEPAEMLYDSTHTNNPPDPVRFFDGGHNGTLTVRPGDSIQYECEYFNTTNQTLRFGNQTYDAEMCLLFGAYTPSLGGPWSCVGF